MHQEKQFCSLACGAFTIISWMCLTCSEAATQQLDVGDRSKKVFGGTVAINKWNKLLYVFVDCVDLSQRRCKGCRMLKI